MELLRLNEGLIYGQVEFQLHPLSIHRGNSKILHTLLIEGYGGNPMGNVAGVSVFGWPVSDTDIYSTQISSGPYHIILPLRVIIPVRRRNLIESLDCGLMNYVNAANNARNNNSS